MPSEQAAYTLPICVCRSPQRVGVNEDQQLQQQQHQQQQQQQPQQQPQQHHQQQGSGAAAAEGVIHSGSRTLSPEDYDRWRKESQYCSLSDHIDPNFQVSFYLNIYF